MVADDREELVRAAAAAVLARLRSGRSRTVTASVGVSGRHVHLTAGDLATLLGPAARLTVAQPLVQPGQFAAAEAVAVIGPGGVLPAVRVVGPVRGKAVAELAAADVFALGFSTDVAAGKRFAVNLAGPAGVVRLAEGGVISRRHLHAAPEEAAALGLGDGIIVRAALGVAGRRVIFDDVLVRVGDGMKLELHIDRDEANACGAKTGDEAVIFLNDEGDIRRLPAGEGRHGARTLVTEADILRARKERRVPAVAGALLTPYARDALRKYFPELAGE